MNMNESDSIDRSFGALLEITRIGSWDFNVKTGEISYSPAWAKILGYSVEELDTIPETWKKMVLPEDLPLINREIEKHMKGETQIYEAEIRMIRKDGTIIWVQDKGQIIEYDEDGSPLRFIGVLQDITSIKKTAEQLRENQTTLDLAINITEMGTWDWDIVANIVNCNDEYLKMLDLTREDYQGNIEEWVGMIHPEDRDRILGTVNDYMLGKSPKLECEMRMRRKDGSYIWTRDMGRIVERDADGNATRIVGGRLNVDVVKRAAERIRESLDALEQHKQDLEKEIENRTKMLTEQDKMLWAVNDISQSLFSMDHCENIDAVIQSSLARYCNACGKERLSLWKNIDIDGKAHCSLLYEHLSFHDVPSFDLNFKQFEKKEILENVIQELDLQVSEEEISKILELEFKEYIPYAEYMPSIHKYFLEGKSLNCITSTLSGFERLQMVLSDVKSFLVSPIILNDEIWGFIGVDNCKTEELFSEVEEKMLSIVGFFLANAIQKNEGEKLTREAEERVQLMLDATPLCCNLWTPDFQNMTCNEEAARLFDLSCQQEYLDRFPELSPEYQPCGRLSSELSLEYITTAFEEGFCKFEWMHQKLDGTPVPSEITLVRVKYKDGYIVAGYTRDLREFNAILAKLQAKENDLRAAMDEALLSSKAKSNFLANMSHEIRTPMNAISGFAEILLRESQNKQSAEYATGIKNACNNLLNIVNDILDISKIESGKIEIFKSQYELSSLLNDSIAISRMRIGNKPLMFVTNIDSNLPARLIGDEIRIKQILINLLSNAIKFTETGHISLAVSGEMIGKQAKLCFDVTDTGFGIKNEDLTRLFAEFERINTTKNRTIEGTGLGLAISKQLCEMMGGKIEVDSIFGVGSVFRVTIMQDCPDYEPLAEVSDKKSVLVYESRDVYLNSVKETIENLGCICIPCRGQSELIDHINKIPYDFIFTSSMHLKKVKTLIEKNNLDVSIIVSADYGENIDDDSVYTVFFPINCLQMSDIFNGQKSNNEFDPKTESIYSFIAPSARVLVVDDNAVNLKVAAGLMLPYEFEIDTAENGLEAIKMVKANTYDLVFMDHMMPEMDGIDATIAIRKLEGDYFQDLPIIALTANAIVGTREVFMREGMNDFLAKPIEIGKLAQMLGKWLPKYKKIAITPSAIRKTEHLPQIIEISGIHVAKGIQSVGGNKDDYLRILSVYYTDSLAKLHSLPKHFDNNDILSFRTEVHALKSTSATIGAMEISALAHKLETAALNIDISYIKANINKFLMELENTLDMIAPHVKPILAEVEKENFSADLALGDMAQLKEELVNLQFASEVANISQIEEILHTLHEYSWPEDIAKQLSDIKHHLAMFDYDSVDECVLALQNIVK